VVHSVRARLALWYAGVFACFLGLFAISAYVFLAHSSSEATDDYLAETAAAVAGAMEFERSRGESDTVAIANVVREFRLREIDVVVFEPELDRARRARNLVTAGSPAERITRVPLLHGFGEILRRAPPVPSLRTVREGGQNVRVYTLPYTLGRVSIVIGTAQSLSAQERTLREAEAALAIGLPVMLLLATLGGYVLARKALHPVVVMGERAAAIGAATLHERLPVANPRDELGRLAAVLNGLLERVERSFEQQRRFMADASHEMRTPVAIISGESELAVARHDRSLAELREALATVHEESRHLRGIVDDLFLLAQADAGERPLAPEALYLNDVVAECARAARTLAQAKNITLELCAGEDDMPLVGDEALLRRLVMNVVDNAIKYTPAGGRVVIRVQREKEDFVVEVEDSGPGVPAESRERIFDRFYRARPAGRSGARPAGAGLGLAIARWVARAHGGALRLARSDDSGSVFRISIPARNAAAT
jgi:heavy metal sensor kinase